MPTLECKDVFEVVLPDGWHVTGEPGRAYDLAPPSGDLGINVSVYRPEGLPNQDTESLVRGFAESLGVAGSELRVVTPSDDARQRRSFAAFGYDGRRWFAGFLIFPGGALLATANCSEGDDASFALGEQIIASIAPLERKRGLFRR